MIPAITSNPNFHKVVVSTGNILNMNRLACKSNEELLDSLKLTLQYNNNDNVNKVELSEVEGKIMRATQELNQKLNENERPEISIGAKLFLDKSSSAYINQAVNAMLQILNVQHVDNVVLSYYSKSDSESIPSTSHDDAPKDNIGSRIENARNEKAVNELKEMWQTLEEFAINKQVSQLGIADLDVDTLKKLHATARVTPTIAQVSISSCCKVPPALTQFCSEQDIQLLTHADPGMLLTDEQFIIPGYRVDWTVRYQVHVRCRSVLTAKGYIVGASKDVA